MHFPSRARDAAISRTSADTSTDDEVHDDENANNASNSEMIGLVKHPNTLRGDHSGITSRLTRVELQDDILSTSPGGYFLVKDESGETCCRIHGEAAIVQNSGFDIPKVFYKNSKIFTDGWGRPLFTMRRKNVTLHQSSQVFDLTGQLLMETKSKFSFTKNKMTATFTNIYDGKPIELEIVGKYTSREAVMRVTSGRMIGRIIRHPGNKYTVEVEAGVDLALAIALGVAFSDRSQENNRSAWTS